MSEPLRAIWARRGRRGSLGGRMTDRIHPRTSVHLKAALDAHLAGKTDHFLHECRMLSRGRHYVVPLPRASPRGAGFAVRRIAGR